MLRKIASKCETSETMNALLARHWVSSPLRTIKLALLGTLLLAGCNAQTDTKSAATTAGSAADPYDITKMDFKPGRAQLTNERHTGAFATGSSLSMDAAVKPLAADAVKRSILTPPIRSSRSLPA